MNVLKIIMIVFFNVGCIVGLLLWAEKACIKYYSKWNRYTITYLLISIVGTILALIGIFGLTL